MTGWARLSALAASAALAAGAVEARCRLALSLALDVSSSVDAEEYRLQANGIAAALLDPEVSAAFFARPGETVAVHVFEWSGARQQLTIVDWMQIFGPGDLLTLADRLRTAERSTDQFPTAIGYALGYAATALAQSPGCDRRVIDISGDGKNNDGFPPRMAYRNFDFNRVTVNGLVVGGDAGVFQYYKNSVIHGPGAFVEQAESYADYAEAIKRKLLKELLPLELSSDEVPFANPVEGD